MIGGSTSKRYSRRPALLHRGMSITVLQDFAGIYAASAGSWQCMPSAEAEGRVSHQMQAKLYAIHLHESASEGRYPPVLCCSFHSALILGSSRHND